MKLVIALLMAPLVIAPDLDQRLAKWKPVKMPYPSAALSPRERQMVAKLVEAARFMGDIYWRQSDPKGLELYKSLANAKDQRERKLRRLLWINAGRFDLVDELKPFVGTSAVPPGRGFYPEDLTREQLDAYVKQHPDRRAAIYDERTVVRRSGQALITVPYNQEYKALLDPAARALREAAALSDDPLFAKFLRLRAGAFLSDDYYPSDLAWLDLQDPKFDVVMGPYEVYTDGLLGVKAAYSGALLIRNEQESAKLALFQKYVPDIQDALPLPAEDRPSKRGLTSPMEVMDTPYRSGDYRHGYQAVATNLPNDPRVHEKKGTKKIFFKNFMDARVNEVILPIAKRLLREDQAARVTGEGYFTDVLLHEISHGLGPTYARQTGGRADIRAALGPIYSGLEEAKADCTGMFALKWLVDRGVLPKERLQEYYASYVGGIFRTLRFGTAEAHGLAELMEFNYLGEHKAILHDAATGRYAVDYARIPDGFAALARELLEIEATGDRARGERWFARYKAVPPELQKALDTMQDIPVDLEPIFDFPDHLR